MHYSVVVVKQIACWTRCVSDEFAISVNICELTKTHAECSNKAVPHFLLLSKIQF